MTEEVSIKTVLDVRESAQKVKTDITAALSSPDAQAKAKAAGRKIGESLSLGIETGRNRQSAEQKEIAHQRRLESIHLRSAATLQQIEARKQAQLDVLRERAAQREIDRLKRIERSVANFGSALSSIGTRLTLGITAPLAALGIAAVKTATDFDSLKRGLIAVSGSSEAAERQLVRLKEVAKLPGLGFREAIQGSINLQAAGLSAERAEKALRVFGNALATVGRGKAELDGVIRALSQIESKGKVSAEEINQLAERIPQIRQIMIKAFGTADTEVIQKAKITSRKFIDAVVTELDKLPKVTGGARNAFENLKDSIEQALLPLGNKLLQTILPAIEKLSPKILGLLESFGKLSPEVQTLAIGFGFAAIAAGPLITAIGNLAIAVTALNAAGTGSGLAALARFGLIGAPLAAGAAALFIHTQRVNDQLAALEEQAKRQGQTPQLKGIPPADAAFLAQFSTPGFLQTDPVTGRVVRPPGGGAPSRSALLGATGKPAIDAKALAEANKAGSSAKKSELQKSIDETKRMTELVAALREADGKLFEEEFKQLQLKIEQDQLIDALKNRAFRAVLTAQGKPLPPQLPNIALPRGLAVTAAGSPQSIAGFPGGSLAALAREAAEIPAKIPQIMSDSERFMRGFADATLSAGDAFEQFGNDVAHALTNVRDLFGSLKRAVLDFFNNLLGSALQNLVRGTLGSLFNGIGGGLGNLFRAPSFAGGGISAPASISQSLFNFGGGGGGGASSLAFPGAKSPEFFNVAGGVGGSSFLGGIGKSLGAAAPLLGLSFGAGLGGPSVLGQIAGSAGGLLAGGLFGAKVGAITGKAAAFFTNPLTAIIGGGLLLGSFLFGRSKQRGRDEELSGQFLLQAQAGIDQLAASVASGQITTLAEARGIFDSQILGTFRQQIGSLKTKSVRESRLNNQVRDLQNAFQSRIPPLIAEQERRAADLARFAANDRRLIPEFDRGGLVPGVDRGRDSVLSLLRPGELVLTRGQQFSVMAQSNPGVFDRAGVPRTPVMSGGAQAFQSGGYAVASQPIVEVTVLIGKQDQTQVFVNGAMTPQGQAAIVKQTRNARREGRL